MKIFLSFALAAFALVAPAFAAKTPLKPPANIVAAFGALHEIDTLAGLPSDIRSGNVTLPNGKNLGGWVLAAPGGAWNATDVIVDPSLPGRRLHFAACDAALCVLHYERGGIAHIHLVVTFVQKGGRWKATWIAYGEPALKDFAALRALLENRSTASYDDGETAALQY